MDRETRAAVERVGILIDDWIAHGNEPQFDVADVHRLKLFAERHMEPKCPACGTTDGIIRPGKVCLNPWHAIEPKGCPTPGACACPGYQEAADRVPLDDSERGSPEHLARLIALHMPTEWPYARQIQKGRWIVESILKQFDVRLKTALAQEPGHGE